MNRLVIDALGWTLVHFLWQGALIAAALCVADLALAKTRAAARYLAACLAFALMLAAPVGTFLTLRAPRGAPAPARTFVANPVSSIAVSNSIAERPSPLGLAGSGASVLRSRPYVSRLLPWVVGVWILGVVALSLRLIGGWWLVRRLVRSSGNVTLEAWQERLGDLAERMRVSRPVRLCRSALVEVPTVIGWLRPVILVPASTLSGLSPAQIEAILAHELAHIRRHDYLVNLLQSVVEMLLFYHPAVWWVSQRIRDERELCCDDLAIRLSGDPVGYARALYELERLRGASVDLALAASGGSLRARIGRLLGLPGGTREVATRGLVGLIGATLVIAVLAMTGLEHSAVLASAGTKLARTVERVASVRVAPVRVSRAIAPRAAVASARVLEAAPEVAPDPETAPAPEVAPEAASTCDAAAAALAAPAATVAAQACVPSVAALAVASAGATVQAVAACNQPNDDAESSATASKVRGRFTAEEWQRMQQHGIGEKYVANLEPNLPELTSDELITLADHGVSSIYVANLRRAGLEHPSVDDLVRLASHGVNSAYVANLHAAGLDHLSVDDLVRLADHGVSSAYVRGLKGMDPNGLSTDELIRLASSGVSSEWYSAMDWMGLSQFSVEEAIQLRNAGITAEYANKLKLVTHRRLTLEELRRLANQGVTSDYAARMYVLFGSSLDVDKLLQMRNQGVSTEYAEQMMVAAGPISIPELIELRNQGIEPGYAYEMSVLGRLETRDLIRLHQSGVSADFVEQAQKAGYAHPSVSDLIRLYQRGLPSRAED